MVREGVKMVKKWCYSVNCLLLTAFSVWSMDPCFAPLTPDTVMGELQGHNKDNSLPEINSSPKMQMKMKLKFIIYELNEFEYTVF